MEERIFQDLDPEARMAEMAKTAVKRECITYRHDFSEEELNEKRKDLADIVTELVDLEEEKKAYTESLNARKKDKEITRNELVGQLKKGGEERTGGCWKYVDYENRVVGYYDADGILVCERDMTPDETQREMQFNDAQEAEQAPIGELPPAGDPNENVKEVDFEGVNEENNENPENPDE